MSMQLCLMFLNDVHGYLEPHPELFYEAGKEVIEIAGGYAAIAAKAREIRSRHPKALLFDGGDTFHGTLPLVQSKGEALVPILNKIGVDAMVGHWDFAYGPAQLKNLAAQLSYPVLGINVYQPDGTLFLPPYLIKEVENIKVAVIGICSNIIDKTMPARFSEGLKVTDGQEELPRIIEQVKAEGADITVLLSHNGFPQDVEMLKRIPGIDICLSSHTHNRLYEAVKINESLVIQCGCHGSFLGELTLNMEQHKIQGYQYQLHPLTGQEADEEVQALVAKAMQPFKSLQAQLAGSTAALLHRYDTLHSSMDTFLLSAVAHAAGVDIAFSNGWRYGAPVPAGNLSKWDLYNIVPMNPAVETAELTGIEILGMLEENLERTFSANPFHQMGGYVKRCLGLTIHMRVENPEGHRIQQIFTKDGPLQKDKSYKVAFITSQGVPEHIGKNRTSTGVSAVEAMEAYLKRHSPYRPPAENAVRLV